MNRIKINIQLGIATFLSSLLLLAACSSEPDYKVIRQDVVELHDKLMADGETAIHLKMKLDTVAITGSQESKTQITELITKLNAADESMMDWMQDFKADVEGMNNAQAVAYFNGEKVKLVKMDSLYKVALSGAEAYLKKVGVDTHSNHDGHDHSTH